MPLGIIATAFRMIPLAFAALLFGIPLLWLLWSVDKASAETLPDNGVILREQCLMTLQGEHPSECSRVFVAQAVHVQPFRAERPLSPSAGDPANLVLVHAGILRGLIPRDDVLSVTGVTRKENNATKLKSWSGPKNFNTFVGDAWGNYEFQRDGRYVFQSGGDDSEEPPERGRLYRAGLLLFVDHSLLESTFFLITPDNKICWFAAIETQCTE